MATGTPSSKAAAQEGDGLNALVAAVLARSLDDRGQLTAEAASVVQLREDAERERLLRDFVIGMMPAEVNPALWTKWLSGEGTPPGRTGLKRPDTDGQPIGRGMSRSSARVTKAAHAVEGKKRAAAAAQERVTEAEQALAEAIAQDAAIVEYAVSEHVARIMAPMFAMGPAWTIMRAVSAHVPAEQMEAELRSLTNPDHRTLRAAAVQNERQDDTDRMLLTMDEWCGDYVFEERLREAVLTVTNAYQGKRRPSAKRRSRSLIFTSVSNQASVADQIEILDGVRVSDF